MHFHELRYYNVRMKWGCQRCDPCEIEYITETQISLVYLIMHICIQITVQAITKNFIYICFIVARSFIAWFATSLWLHCETSVLMRFSIVCDKSYKRKNERIWKCSHWSILKQMHHKRRIDVRKSLNKLNGNCFAMQSMKIVADTCTYIRFPI